MTEADENTVSFGSFSFRKVNSLQFPKLSMDQLAQAIARLPDKPPPLIVAPSIQVKPSAPAVRATEPLNSCETISQSRSVVRGSSTPSEHYPPLQAAPTLQPSTVAASVFRPPAGVPEDPNAPGCSPEFHFSSNSSLNQLVDLLSAITERLSFLGDQVVSLVDADLMQSDECIRLKNERKVMFEQKSRIQALVNSRASNESESVSSRPVTPAPNLSSSVQRPVVQREVLDVDANTTGWEDYLCGDNDVEELLMHAGPSPTPHTGLYSNDRSEPMVIHGTNRPYSSTSFGPSDVQIIPDIDYQERNKARADALINAPALQSEVHQVKCDAQWRQDNFPWSSRISGALNFFQLKNFRECQREIINAVMAGKDVFALLPTGGGKSLCYQLPAIVSGGLTVVVSPLVSLIQDQVTRLREVYGICATALGSADAGDVENVYPELSAGCPELKILYLTPEKIARSGKLMSALKRLNDMGRLDRIAIDEAHCVSTWGHDFRPDYRALKTFKTEFRGVPILALTATATSRVMEDVQRQLHVPKFEIFTKSFNRSNLTYEVRKKTKDVVKEMAEIIKDKYAYKSGIIYCCSKAECEKVADSLCQLGVNAGYYHAGMSPGPRADAQRRWSNDEIRVLCATVAFGMGIDKPDVRYVFHYSLPKSLEDYYQESGRAGRDGNPSLCILFYSYGDKAKSENLLSSLPQDQLARAMHSLQLMIAYCENAVECRRVLQLQHLGETFDKQLCRGSCDNCSSSYGIEERDGTAVAKESLDCVIEILGRDKRITMLQLVDILRGLKNAKTAKNQMDKLKQFGCVDGKKWSDEHMRRLLQEMIRLQVFQEEVVQTFRGVASYLSIGSEAGKLRAGKLTIPLKFRSNKRTTSAVVVEKSTAPSSSSRHELDAISNEAYGEMVTLRQACASESNIRSYMILQNEHMDEISKLLPTKREQFADYMLPKTLEKYADRFLEITRKFAKKKKAVEKALSKATQEDVDEPSTAPAVARAKSKYFSSGATGEAEGGPRWMTKKPSSTKSLQSTSVPNVLTLDDDDSDSDDEVSLSHAPKRRNVEPGNSEDSDDIQATQRRVLPPSMSAAVSRTKSYAPITAQPSNTPRSGGIQAVIPKTRS